jgi:hypothetical protein
VPRREKIEKIAALLTACKSTYKWNFADMKKSARILRSSQLWLKNVQVCKIPLVSTLKKHARGLNIFHPLCVSILVGEVVALLMACKSTYCS